MEAREIAELAVAALKYAPETYLELLQNEDYEEIEYQITEFISEE